MQINVIAVGVYPTSPLIPTGLESVVAGKEEVNIDIVAGACISAITIVLSVILLIMVTKKRGKHLLFPRYLSSHQIWNLKILERPHARNRL